ncbi:urease accessory protein UreD [Tsukamurella strandjordii]|uniref:Urease accessory protein UreD n=1 Tax=Tsukamurella strandjordii TaxID=147577 RepID=A0AA90SLD2_9ACTN|nr:urease accessory protein UreD [Tsukamurella strandjordii]MDP0398078.1 urease accessory protein UreD [Tsukamurella strandjordii]
MSAAAVAVRAASPRAHVDLVGGTIVPRLVSRTPDGARIALVAGGALLLPGDEVRIDITVGAGASLELEDIGGTVCYGEADGGGPWSRWTVHVTVEAGGRLRWDGLPLVVADGARVHRRTSVTLAEGATAVLRETSVLGRTGERGGELRAEFVAEDGLPLLVEDLRVRGDAPEPGVLGGRRVYDTVTALGFRPPTVPGLDVLDLDRPGAVARYLGDETHRSPLDGVTAAWTDG